MKKFLIALALVLAGPAYAQKFQADSNINITSGIITGVNTPITISNKAATVYSIDVGNTNSAAIFLKLYNAASMSACGTGTPFARYTIPTSVSAVNTTFTNTNGDIYVSGVIACIVKGIADSDTTAPAGSSGTYNIHWKQSP